MNRVDIIKKYVELRQSGQVEKLLELFEENATLVTMEESVYTGKNELKKYYSASQARTATVSDVHKNTNNSYYVDLSFAMGLKVIRALFMFADDSDLIHEIRLTNVGWI